MSKEQLFREIYKLQQEADEYIDKLPSDIATSYVDNGYVNPQLLIQEKLMQAVFNEHYESVCWFLYEWKRGYEVGIGGIETKIYSIDEYIEWMKLNEGFGNA